MSDNGSSFNKNVYNIFSICEEFRQRLAELQRLKSVIKKDKQDLEKSDVSKEKK